MEREMEHPIVYLTADAVVSALGFSTEACWKELIAYRCGVSSIDNSALYAAPFAAAQISEIALQKELMKSDLAQFTRLEQFFILAIRQTIEKSAIDVSSPECGLIISSTKGNIGLLTAENENGSELFITELAARVATHFGFSTKPVVVCNACISGISALIVAERLIRNGVYKHVIVAGGDELSRFVVTGFHAFKSVSAEVCRPYDATRDGLSLGEACGSLLLTAERGCVSEKLPVSMLGGAISNDANHISGPSRTGEELAMAIASAMRQADLQPHVLSFVNAHGTATAYNDEMESKALHIAGLVDTPMQSLKPFIGHTLGASGVVETIFCKKQLEENVILGIPNFQANGVSFPLNISSRHRPIDSPDCCVKIASGFGGCNAAIILGLNRASELVRKTKTPAEIKRVSRCRVDAAGVRLNGKMVLERSATDSFSVFIRKAYTYLQLDYRKFYKMDDLSKLGFITAEFLLRQSADFSSVSPENKGVVAANRSASLNTDINYRRNIDAVGDYEGSPAIFVYTLPNVMLGELCIRWKMKGENTFFIQNEPDFDFLERYTRIAMAEQGLEYCVVGWCDLLDDDFFAEFLLVQNIDK